MKKTENPNRSYAVQNPRAGTNTASNAVAVNNAQMHNQCQGLKNGVYKSGSKSRPLPDWNKGGR
jgi:hypothetical protein